MDSAFRSLCVLERSINYAGRHIYQFGIVWFKVALCISYLRLLACTNWRLYKRVIWIVITVMVLGHTAFALGLIFICKPVEKAWKPYLPGHCLSAGPRNGVISGVSSFTIASDVVVAILPIPILRKLNIKKVQRYGLCALFLLGLLTTVCSIFRFVQISRTALGDGDTTMLTLWGTIEFNVGLMRLYRTSSPPSPSSPPSHKGSAPHPQQQRLCSNQEIERDSGQAVLPPRKSDTITTTELSEQRSGSVMSDLDQPSEKTEERIVKTVGYQVTFFNEGSEV
ncbi:hypothetical protein H2199_003259 [Coniosporium tulheliwenetii]|uniref:Uncharacterized protein n=1 Tax=Coniosporium tulheliwenetii TaxID=3383036 RepID=A0ACC2ZBX9_9PEZI|nr:hypothetical protein H2199_003259 [Cladosporium sp. JES 115]